MIRSIVLSFALLLTALPASAQTDVETPVDIEKPTDVEKPIDIEKPTNAPKTADIEKPAETEKPAVAVVKTEFDAKELEHQIQNADLAFIDRLHQEGFDFNLKDSTGNSALYYALTRNPDLEVSRRLIKYGADVNAPSVNGMLPLNIATSKANELQLQIVMMQAMGLDTSDEAVQNELKKNLFREMNKAIAMTQMLLENGADVNMKSALGTPLMNAVTNTWNNEIVELLIKAGANVNETDEAGRTAIFYAAASGNDDMVTALIKAGADPDHKDNSGKTYLEIEKTAVDSPF